MRFFKSIVALLCVSGCAMVESDDSVAFTSLVRGAQTGLGATRVRVARSAAEWELLWNAHASHALDAAPAPLVDFEHDMVVFVNDGQHPTSGWALEVTGARVVAGELVLQARVTAPAPELLQAQVISTPFEGIVTERNALPIRVEYERVTAQVR